MTAPPPDPTLGRRVLDVLTILASVAGSLAIVWGFLKMVGKPWYDWRQRRQAAIIREVLKPQLDALDSICAREEANVTANRELFKDFDKLMEIALDNRDRLDDMNNLLDALGFASRDRRADSAGHQEKMTEIVEGLIERRRQRRRGGS